MSKFTSVTVFMVATNETLALRESINIIRKTCNDDDIEKIVVVLKDSDSPSYRETQKIIEETNDGKIDFHLQSEPIIDTLSKLPLTVKGSHFMFMASDLETDPNNVKDFIERAKRHPQRIICAAKWLKESEVQGYDFLHELGSRAINNFVRYLYRLDVREPFSFYQIYPKSVYDGLTFSDPKKFLYEYSLLPLKLGVEYEEIPTVCKSRKDGKSNYNYLFYFKMAFEFCWTAVKIRFSKGYKNERKTK